MEPYDKPTPGPRRSSRLNPPHRAMRRQLLRTIQSTITRQRRLSKVFKTAQQKAANTFLHYSTQKQRDMLDLAEKLSPWNPESDPCQVSSILQHRFLGKGKTKLEFLVQFAVDDSQAWVPYASI